MLFQVHTFFPTEIVSDSDILFSVVATSLYLWLIL